MIIRPADKFLLPEGGVRKLGSPDSKELPYILPASSGDPSIRALPRTVHHAQACYIGHWIGSHPATKQRGLSLSFLLLPPHLDSNMQQVRLIAAGVQQSHPQVRHALLDELMFAADANPFVLTGRTLDLSDVLCLMPPRLA